MTEPDPILLMDGDPRLAERSHEVEDFSHPLIPRLITVMVRIVVARNALGLAAVQIGVPLRVIVVTDGEQLFHMINPVMIRALNQHAVAHEGCLSVPRRHWRPVSRPRKCEVEWTSGNGKVERHNFSGVLARVIQHEMDHLDGVLITSKKGHH